MPKVFRAFICGAHEDREFVDRLCAWLRKRGVVPTSVNLRLRLDTDITNFGQLAMEELGDIALAVVSPTFLADSWLTQELTAFLLAEKQPCGIPVRAIALTEPLSFPLLEPLKSRSFDFTQSESEAFARLEAWLETVKPSPAAIVFISHTHTDRDLARAVAEVLGEALRLEKREIRCTSVAEYQLKPILSDYAEELAREIREADTFIALATKDGLASTWVLFELGARWGARRHCIPLLARGGREEDLPEPIRRANVIDIADPGQIQRLVSELARWLGRKPRDPVDYENSLKELVALAPEPRPEHQ